MLFLAILPPLLVTLVIRYPFHATGIETNKASNRPSPQLSIPIAAQLPVLNDEPADLLWPRALNYTPFWTSVAWHSGNGSHGYPFTLADLTRSLTLGNRCTFLRAFARADAGFALRLSVIGGSMTRGSGCCADPSAWQHCAWPHHLEKWLATVRPAWRVTMHNAAVGGCGSACWAHKLQSGRHAALDADIILVDTGVNDRGLPPYRLLLDSDALMWGLLQRAGTTGDTLAAGTMSDTPASDMAKTVPAVPTANSAPAVMNVVGYWRAGDAQTAAARHYGIPIASYRDAVWASYEHVPYASRIDSDFAGDPHHLFWMANNVGNSHPNQTTHELVGDVVKFAFSRMLLEYDALSPAQRADAARDSCSSAMANSTPLMGAINADRRPCGASSMLDRFDRDTNSTAALTAARVHTTGSWSFEHARPVGWHGRGEGSLSLRVRFGATPRLNLEYLRSYDGMATVIVSVTHCQPVTLNAAWSHRYSLPFVMALHLVVGQNGNATSGVPPSTHTACGDTPDSHLRAPWDAESHGVPFSASYNVACGSGVMNATDARVAMSFLPGTRAHRRFVVMGFSTC